MASERNATSSNTTNALLPPLIYYYSATQTSTRSIPPYFQLRTAWILHFLLPPPVLQMNISVLASPAFLPNRERNCTIDLISLSQLSPFARGHAGIKETYCTGSSAPHSTHMKESKIISYRCLRSQHCVGWKSKPKMARSVNDRKILFAFFCPGWWSGS
jgi:hypothetical protein